MTSWKTFNDVERGRRRVEPIVCTPPSVFFKNTHEITSWPRLYIKPWQPSVNTPRHEEEMDSGGGWGLYELRLVKCALLKSFPLGSS